MSSLGGGTEPPRGGAVGQQGAVRAGRRDAIDVNLHHIARAYVRRLEVNHEISVGSAAAQADGQCPVVARLFHAFDKDSFDLAYGLLLCGALRRGCHPPTGR